MAKYGGYETVGTLIDTPLATVCTARPVGAEADALETYVVKVFHPFDLGAGAEGSSAGTMQFLDAARVQAQVAASEAKHWAPVYESGTCEDGAYYVTKYYAHSLDDLLRVTLDTRTLHVIIESVVKGLAELKAACGRPHGNLKLTNVLVTSGDDVSRTGVFLSDPLPTARMDLPAGVVGDIRAVGELIYRLVLHKAPQAMGGKLVPRSEAWQRLGKRGDAWRDLCSRLLATPEGLSLEKLAEELEPLRERRISPWRIAVPVVGLLLVATVGTALLLLREPPGLPPAEFRPEQWKGFCEDHYNWFAKFQQDLDKVGAGRRERWRGDPDLSKLLALYESRERQGVEFNPAIIAGKPTARAIDLKDDAPEAARTAEGIERTAKAAGFLEQLRKVLCPRDKAPPPEWSKLAEVRTLADTWSERGWKKPAQYLASFADDVKAGPKLCEAVDRVMEISENKRPRAIEALWTSVAAYEKEFAESSDKVLARFQDYAAAEVRSEAGEASEKDLETIEKALQNVAALGRELAAVVKNMQSGKVARDLFLKEASVHTSSASEVSEYTFRGQWLKEVKGYYILDADPRGTREAWSARTDKIKAAIAELEKLGGEATTWARKFQERLAGEVQGKIDAMWQIAAIVKDQQNLEGRVRQVDYELGQLKADVERTAISFAGKPEEWLALTKTFRFASPAVNARWERAKAALLPKNDAEAKALATDAERTKYLDLRAKVQKLQTTLAGLAEGLPASLPEEAEKHQARGWHNAFVGRVRAKREETLQEAMKLAGDADVPDLADAAFQKGWGELRQKYREWWDETGKVVAGFGALESRLDACYLLDEAAKEGEKTTGELCDEWSKRPFLEAEPDLRRALDGVVQRVESLRQVTALSDRAALVARGLSEASREVALAAWRRLGSLEGPPWPTAAEEFQQETKLRKQVASELLAMADAPRRDALREELRAGGLKRDTQWMAAHLERLQKTIEGSGDKVLAQFGKFAEAELKGVDKSALADYLKALESIRPLAESLAALVERDWGKRVAGDLFAQDSAVHRELDASNGPTRKTLEGWLTEVKQYYYLPENDPLAQQNTALDKEEGDIRRAIAVLQQRGEKEKAAAQNLIALLKRDVEPRSTTPPVVKNRAKLEACIETARKALKDLRGSVTEIVAVVALESDIAELVKTIEGSGDSVLARIGTWVAAETKAGTEEALEARKAKLTEVKAFVAPFAALVEGDWAAGKIDRSLFAKESKVHQDFESTGAVTRKVLEDWLKELNGYYVLAPDPRGTKDDWTKKAQEIGGRIDELAKFGGQYGQKAAQLRTRLNDVASRSVEPLWLKVAVRKNLADLNAAIAAANKSLGDLKGEVEGAFEREPQWRERVTKIEQVAASDAINRKWREARDALLAKNPSKELQADTSRYLGVRGALEGLETFLKALDDPKSLPPPPKDWPKTFADEAASKREEALGKAIAAVQWADGVPAQAAEEFKGTEAWRSVVAAYSGSLQAIGGVQKDVSIIQAQTAAGYLPSDKPDDAPKGVRQVLEEWDKQQISPALLREFGQVVKTARDLVAIEGLGRPQLAERAKGLQPNDPPQVPLIVWVGLGRADDWPGSLAELKVEETLRSQVAAAAAKVRAANPHPVRWVDDALAKEGTRRWEVCFASLLKKGSSDAELGSAIKAAAELFKVDAAARAQMAPGLQFRWLLWEFHQQIAATPQTATKEDLLKAVADYGSRAAALPGGIGAKPAAAGLLTEMRTVLEKMEEAGPGEGLDKGGPASTKLGTWKPTIAADGKSVEYAWSEKPHGLTFVRVEPRGGGKPVYLSTAEVSLGLFADVVGAADRWGDLKELLNLDGLKNDLRKGPRVWQPVRSGESIQVSRDWLVPLPGVRDPYPEGGTPPLPSSRHPMQYLAPEAALYVARLLGCRLPTVAEWEAAWETFEKGKDDAKWNLRDKAWDAQQEHVRKLKQTVGRGDWPDAGSFTSPVVDPPAKAGQDATLTRTTSDGTLWFAPVGAGAANGPAVQHLVGNVAELVYDNPARVEEALKSPSDLTASRLSDFVAKEAKEFRVVGGSALSPPEYWDGVGKPFSRPLALDLTQARGGYSDVGFRLAFTAPRDAPAARVAAVLKKHGYLPALD